MADLVESEAEEVALVAPVDEQPSINEEKKVKKIGLSQVVGDIAHLTKMQKR